MISLLLPAFLLPEFIFLQVLRDIALMHCMILILNIEPNLHIGVSLNSIKTISESKYYIFLFYTAK